MDMDFSSREGWCTPVLKRGLGSGKWRTHFLVLEEVVGSVEESTEQPHQQRHEGGDGEKTAVAVRTFGRVETGHEDRDLELVKATERMEIVLV